MGIQWDQRPHTVGDGLDGLMVWIGAQVKAGLNTCDGINTCVLYFHLRNHVKVLDYCYS